MNLRRLTPADAPAYRTLMLDAYARHPDVFTSTVPERAALPLTWWQARIGADPLAASLVLGAFQDAQLTGVAGLKFETREKARHKAMLFGIYVAPTFRQSGIGRQLGLTALDTARTRDHVKLVQLTVSQGNTAAQTLYEQCGFVVFGVEPFAIAVASGYVSKVHMWCSLALAADNLSI